MRIARIAHLTRAVSTVLSRRALAATLGLGAPGLHGSAEARKKRKKRKTRITRNAFGCVNVGELCKNGGHCCSGICQGKQGKKRCQAHGTGGCQSEQDDCVEPSGCPEKPTSLTSRCYRTTGNTSVCGIGVAGACIACARDADCEAGYGPGAACVICASCPGQQDTACMPTAL